jgi:hypothetical protein
MSYFRRPDPALEEPEATQDAPRTGFADVAGRFANWITGADRMPEVAPEPGDEAGHDPIRELSARAEETEPSRFPVAPFGYNRAAVDEQMSGLERELSELRAAREPTLSITEELEKIGEQTASILVVAHDQAHETTRVAQEQAERCVADAAANAVAITAEARQRLSELDSETDSVWRERERLLEDVRVVSAALSTLADEASQRFPAAAESSTLQQTQSVSIASGMRHAAPPWMASEPDPANGASIAPEPQRTEPFDSLNAGEPADQLPHDPHGFPRATHPGDTGSWFAGLEPPESPMQ